MPDYSRRDELVLQWTGFVRQLARRYARVAGVPAEDLAGEILLDALRRFPAYNPARGAFSTWLSIVARRTAHEFRRAAGTQARSATLVRLDAFECPDATLTLADHREPDPAEAAADAELFRRVEVALAELPPTWSQAVRERAELAAREPVDVSRERVRQRAEQGLRRMRERLGVKRSA